MSLDWLVSPQWRGTYTLFKKEVFRFWRVAFQTVASPVLSALLYLLIFSHALSGHVEVYKGVEYTSFLIPGLIMMSLLQNAFANSSSSLVQSKVMGSIVFVLLTPLTYLQFFIAFLAASIIRGMMVGLSIYLVAIWFVHVPITHIGWIITFALTDLSQVEFALSELRNANIVVEDMQLIEADLEDVFLSLVGGA